MKRQPDWPALLLLIALLFGGLARFMPALMARFPINDGGMFYTMAGELSANGYALPATTSYNGLDLPYAYPPFGIYLVSLLSDLARVPPLGVFLWLPPILATLAIPAFYLLSRVLLGDNLRASLATLFFALTPGRYDWHIMGGGVTRAAGMLFLLLAAFYVLRLFQLHASLRAIAAKQSPLVARGLLRREERPPRNDGAFRGFESNQRILVSAIVFSSLAVLSHPEVGLQTFGLCAVLWLFFGRTRRGAFHAFLVALGVFLLTAPWWGTVLAYHGPSPFLSALQTGQHATIDPLSLVVGLLASGEFIPILLLLRAAGLVYAVITKRWIFIALVFAPAFLDPRSAASIAFLSLSMLAALGFLDALPAFASAVSAAVGLPPASSTTAGATSAVSVSAAVGLPPAGSTTAGGTRSALVSRVSGLTLLLLAFTLFLECGLLNFRLVNTTLTADERETMAWLRENLPPDQNFLILTGKPYSMSDPVQEWFPVFAGQRSRTTLQGLEWTLGAEFTGRLNDLVVLQACDNFPCMEKMSVQMGLSYDYIWLSIPIMRTNPEQNARANQSLDSIQSSSQFSIVFDELSSSERIVIFERVEK